jgi:hypothetical protein
MNNDSLFFLRVKKTYNNQVIQLQKDNLASNLYAVSMPMSWF